MFKYITRYNENIEKIEITSETEQYVIFENGRRDKKMTQWACYFNTWKSAYDYILDRKLKHVQSAEEHLSCLKDELERIKKLKEF
jgi:hypothetical protein